MAEAPGASCARAPLRTYKILHTTLGTLFAGAELRRTAFYSLGKWADAAATADAVPWRKLRPLRPLPLPPGGWKEMHLGERRWIF